MAKLEKVEVKTYQINITLTESEAQNLSDVLHGALTTDQLKQLRLEELNSYLADFFPVVKTYFTPAQIL